MKLPLLLALALALTACDNVVSTPDPTPAPATPPPATPVPAVAGQPGGAGTAPGSPAPKPGAWMNEAKTGLDRSGPLGSKQDGPQKKK